MVQVVVFGFNPFMVNTYLVFDGTGECLVIDAGNYSAGEDQRLSDFIAERGLLPVMAVNTHGHVDHLLGVDYVKRTYGVPFAVHGADNFLVESAPVHGRIYGFSMAEPPVVDIDLSTMDEIRFGESALKIIHTPGHTPGHVCLWDEAGKQLFTGDTLFRESIGRTDLPGGDYSWIMRSLLEKIMPLGGDVTIYPGHGAKSTLGHESLYNPFITEVMNGEVGY